MLSGARARAGVGVMELGAILCVAVSACSDSGPFGTDSVEEGVRLTADRAVYQLEETGKLELFNGSRHTISVGGSCFGGVQRRSGSQWEVVGGLWPGPCVGPPLALEPRERHTVTFTTRGAPISTVNGTILGPFRSGGEYRVCTTVRAERRGPDEEAAVCTDPFRVELAEWTPPLVSLATGSDHTCGVTADGDAFCWGHGHYGQLGDGELDAGHREAKPVPVEGGHRFVSIAAGTWHTCGIAEEGEAYCWGRGHAGQLGSGSVSPAAAPTPVSGGYRFSHLAAGGSRACGITEDGTALCWGFGGAGRLGTGSTASSATPVEVAGEHRFVSLAVGGSHSCGLTDEGALYCWGFNGEGQLGTSEVGEGGTATPVPVTGEPAFRQVVAGEAHTCARTPDGAARCWGRNTEGQLGEGSTADRTAPVAVAGERVFTALGAGDHHSCGVAADGVLYCWGLNELGQLGNGAWGAGGAEGAGELLPVPAFSGHPFSSVEGGGSHTCGVRPTGAPYCWGLNQHGQIGDGSRVTQNRPAAVLRPPDFSP